MFVASLGRRGTLANLRDGLPDLRTGRGGLVLGATRRRLVLAHRHGVRNAAPSTPEGPLAALPTREPTWGELVERLVNAPSKEKS